MSTPLEITTCHSDEAEALASNSSGKSLDGTDYYSVFSSSPGQSLCARIIRRRRWNPFDCTKKQTCIAALLMFVTVVSGLFIMSGRRYSLLPCLDPTSEICRIDPVSHNETVSGSQVKINSTIDKKQMDSGPTADTTPNSPNDGLTSDKFSHICQDESSMDTLILVSEAKFSSLFHDAKGQNKFEASSVVLIGNSSTAFAVCDSSWSISKFDYNKLDSDYLESSDNMNIQVGDPKRKNDDSQYESIFYDSGIFLAVRESIKIGKEYHAIIEELQINPDYTDYTVLDSCPCDFQFEGTSKGFEGAVPLRGLDDTLFVLGLCEGNHCSETRNHETGNGKIIIMQKQHSSSDGSSSCRWVTVRSINIPHTADFSDYSDIAITDQGRVAITSQEDSKLWVGQLLGRQENGILWDIDAVEFEILQYAVYDFPKSHKCHLLFCNIEGVSWINQMTIVTVSDKMKGNGKQNERCAEKDQSVHLFAIPVPVP